LSNIIHGSIWKVSITWINIIRYFICIISTKIGNSDKKAQVWTNGQFGYGIYSFMACCQSLEITTNDSGQGTLYIPINVNTSIKIEFTMNKPLLIMFMMISHAAF